MRRFGRILLVTGGTLVVGLLVACLAVSLSIGAAVRQAAATARQHYAGDSVEALILQVGDPGGDLRDRNRAVWALGQLGDPGALDALSRLQRGGPCDHENRVCERELEKAIRLLNGGLNLSALVWR
jgi:HEAT repeat protein